MLLMRWVQSIAALPAVLVFLSAANTYAEEEEKEKDTYTIELVSANEEGEIIDEFTMLAEDAMVESAARHKQEIGMAPSAITVITREDIEASGATTVTDVLRLVPGMEVIRASPFYSAITARLNWNSENNHFLVLIDGREINNELLGQPLLEVQPISLEDIERIEVILGPGSFLYGANALAGVVSITTRAVPDKTSAWALLAGGEIGSARAGARASARFGSWGISVSGEVDLSGRFFDHRKTGKELWKFRTVAEYRLGEKTRVLVDGGISGGLGIISTSVSPIEVDMDVRSVRAAYDSEKLRGQLYWNQMLVSAELRVPFDYAGIRLADIKPFDISAHTLDSEVQWTLPGFWEPLMLIVGGTGRLSTLSSSDLLDGKTFADRSSPNYHKPGVDHLEARAAAFLHAELSPADWLTATGDLRFDYNTVSGEFVSPRLAAVFRPARDHFLRLGASRAFRKPSYLESHAHLNADFPAESPFAGPSEDTFREFLARSVGNSKLGPEELMSVEAGYRGEFFEKKLSVSLDLYYNLYMNRINMDDTMVDTPQGFPDLDRSSFHYINKPKNDRYIIGSELAIHYKPSRNFLLMAAWSYRGLYDRKDDEHSNNDPKHLLTLGARFRTDSGLVGSLYIFTRSEFRAGLGNPEGLLEKSIKTHMDNVMLVLGKIGWRVDVSGVAEFEAGLKLFLPVSPFSSPYFRYNEMGGTVTETGEMFGGDLLRRMVTGYLQGSF
jgi:iron complex outermembrane receptor protein